MMNLIDFLYVYLICICIYIFKCLNEDVPLSKFYTFYPPFHTFLLKLGLNSYCDLTYGKLYAVCYSKLIFCHIFIILRYHILLYFCPTLR